MQLKDQMVLYMQHWIFFIKSMFLSFRRNSTSIICKTNECQDIHAGDTDLKNSKTCPFCDKITLTIDNFRTNVMNKSFCYRPNPVIEDISRNSTIIRYVKISIMTYLKTFLGFTFGNYFNSCAFQHIVCHIDKCNLSVSRRNNMNIHFYFRF